jgi:hypothetical protein
MKIDINNITQSYIEHVILAFNDGKYLINENDVVNNIYKRLVFIDFIDKNYDQFEKYIFGRSFLRSLQAYLLFSSSDSLGNGISYYSFDRYIENNKNLKIFENYIGKQISIETIKEVINVAYKDYETKQSVKQSFFNFWNSIDEYLKIKIVLCYYPTGINLWQKKYPEIIEKFYKVYRNPFTHSAQNNFPPINFYKTKSKSLPSELVGIAYKDINDAIHLIEIPLFDEEAVVIYQNSKAFYFVTADGSYSEKIFDSPMDIIHWNTELCSYKNDIGDIHYIHNGIMKLLTMAIISGCNLKEKNA